MASNATIKYEWSILTTIILCTLHLKVTTLANFDIALAFLLIPLWLFYTYPKVTLTYSKKGVILFSIGVLLPFLPFWNIADITEFIKTYAQYLISIILVFLFSFGKKPKINSKTVENTLFYFQIILLTLTLIQHIEYNIIGNASLYNIWGKNQLYYQLEPNSRMKGFYLEPSYLAFVTVSVFWCRLYLNNKFNLFNFVISFSILWFSQSAFGLGAFTLISIYYFYLSASNRSLIYKLSFYSLVLIPLIVVSLTIYDRILDFFRLDEIFIDGEHVSGFMRFVLPIYILDEIWQQGQYLGVTFGQIEPFVDEFITKLYGETGINNSFYLILAYFGIIGLFFYAILLFIHITTNRSIIKCFILLFFLNLHNSGALVTSQFVFVAYLLPMLVIKQTSYR